MVIRLFPPGRFVQLPRMTQPIVAPAGHRKLFHRHWTWWCMVAALVLVVGVRLRLLDLPLERDEGEYAYAGQLLLQGVPPYQLAYNMKFPGTYAAYAVIMAVFGETPAGIHLGVLCVIALTAGMLFWLGRRLLDETAGLVTASAYVVMAASPGILGLEGHAAHFAALFATAGLCCFQLIRQPVRWPGAIAGGFLLGTAMLMIQDAVFFCLWGLIFVTVTGARRTKVVRAGKLPLIAAYCLGAVLPFGLTCLVLWHAGVLPRFWFWTISYARQYVSIVPLTDAPTEFFTGFSKAVGGNVMLWVAAVIGIRMLWLDRLRGARFALIGFVVASLLATCPGFFFRPHYFLLTLPAVALLVGCFVSGAEEVCQFSNGSVALRQTWPGLVFVLALAVSVFLNRQVWFDLKPAQASRAIYDFNLFSQAERAAAFIRTDTPPNARVAVVGSEPEIYFLSHRRSATGYIYTYALMEPQPFARRMQEEMIQEIESVRPECVAVVTFNDSWISRPESGHEIFDWWDSYRTNYNFIRSFGIHPAPEGSAILIYRRKLGTPLSRNDSVEHSF
jgi:hypothetical protein